MDVSELAGRVIAMGIPGPAIDNHTRAALEAIRPGTVVLFGRNVVDPGQLRALTDALHALPWRPLVAIDHEGGRVCRLGAPFTAFPGAAELGRTDAALARAVGAAIGRELAAAGIDVNYAPVLDVARPDADPVIGDRAFGTDPRRVAELGVAFAQGLASSGIIACGKHFPGHGACRTDSHVAPAMIDAPRDVLEAIDLPPFRAVIAAGLPMLMTAHIRYPALDAGEVATCSAAVVGALLRHALGYGGVVVSDDLGMAAVRHHGTPGAAAVCALAAGVDGVLICHDLDAARAVAAHLADAVRCGTLPRARLTEAATRIVALRVQRRAPAALDLPVAAHAALAAQVRAVAAAARA